MLKSRVCKALVLQIFNPKRGTIREIHIDASAIAIGVVFLLKFPKDIGFHPVEFFL